MNVFFHLIFPCANIFFVLRPHPPPISFLMVRPLFTIFILDFKEDYFSVSYDFNVSSIKTVNER